MRLFETSRQAPLFAVFFCLGIFLGVVYGLLYVFRRGRSKVFADIIFSLVYGVGFALCAYFFNSGEIRLYFFVAVFTGFLCERPFIGYFIKKSIDFSAKVLYNFKESPSVKSKWAKLKK